MDPDNDCDKLVAVGEILVVVSDDCSGNQSLRSIACRFSAPFLREMGGSSFVDLAEPNLVVGMAVGTGGGMIGGF